MPGSSCTACGIIDPHHRTTIRPRTNLRQLALHVSSELTNDSIKPKMRNTE